MLKTPPRAAPRPLVYLVVASLLAGVVWTACGQSSEPELPPGRVTCDPLTELKSYRYRTGVTLDLAARDPSMEPTDGYDPEAFTLDQVVEGAVEREGKIEATARTTEPAQSETSTIVIEDRAWVSAEGIDWTFIDPTSGAFPIPYLPVDTCNAVAPDIDVSGETGELETVGDVPSRRYSFDSLSSRLPARHPSFGAQSDAGRLVSEFRGDVWIAEKDRYITKLELEGTGSYENGRQLTMKIFYEVFNQNDGSIRIEAPQVTPGPPN